MQEVHLKKIIVVLSALCDKRIITKNLGISTNIEN